MPDDTPRPDSDPPASPLDRREAPETASPVLPGRWSVGRVLLALFLLAHWTAVLAWAIPADAAPASIPVGEWSARAIGYETRLPVLDTHRGKDWVSIQETSPVYLYLTLTNQRQRWKMFTPRHPLAAFLAIHYREASGEEHFVRIADPDRFSRPRWVRWRQLEWTLMNNYGIAYHLPHSRRPLVEYFAPGPWTAATLRKHFCVIPVLHESELTPGVELFISSEDYARRIADPQKLPKATRPDKTIGPESDS